MSDSVNPVEESSFEDSLQKLETLVKSMEGGNLRLSELVAAYEKGVTLMKHCEQELQKAELRIQTLSQDSGTTAFDPTA
ncbi:MAG: exodeoxyribonuclease VII small subunit [Verrucomicrobia bacterium]|nr:exodeoxyribonuclease VII small subunit [Verrucomicrobiota bacterium]